MPRYPSLFQINTRVWLNHLSRKASKPITLADIGNATFDGFAEQGFDWVWLLSVWQTGAAGRAVSRGDARWRAEFKALLPDLTEDDIPGSGFAITAYVVSDALGGDMALAEFREKLAWRTVRGADRPAVGVHVADAPPRDAYVSAQYDKRWFWIADTDIQSKYTFGIIMLLFSIADTGVRGSALVVTIPANQ